MQFVQEVVAEELAPWPVHEKVKVGYHELYDVFSRIRRRLEGPRGVTNELFPLLKYVIGEWTVRKGFFFVAWHGITGSMGDAWLVQIWMPRRRICEGSLMI